MKPKSELVLLVCAALSVSNASAITPEKVNGTVANIVQQEMTDEAQEVFSELCSYADNRSNGNQPGSITSADPRWKRSGFDRMNDDARTIFCSVHRHYGRVITFTEQELSVNRRNRTV